MPEGGDPTHDPEGVAHPATLTLSAPGGRHDDESRPALPAIVAGRYRIRRLLGAGGMGEVYVASDDELDREVALKVVRETGGKTSDPVRLVREARALAKLNHPNIVAIHDAGQVDGVAFIIMELVAGRTLWRWREERARGPGEIVRALLAAGEGIAAAHRAGLVHRDIKPDNILVGDDGRVRVADFGLARAIDAGGAEPAETAGGSWRRSPEDRLTVTGALVGTPMYLAPERYAGGAASAASDQYEWFQALAEALLGRALWSGKALAELAAMKRAPELPLADLKVPRALRRVIARGLEPDPDARFPSMDEAVAAVRRAARSSPRRRVAAGLALAGALVAAGVVAARGAGGDACGDAGAEIAAVWGTEARARVARRIAEPEAILRALDGAAERWRSEAVAVCRASRHETFAAELRPRALGCLELRRLQLASTVAVVEAGIDDAARWELELVRGLDGEPACAAAEQVRRSPPLPAGDGARASLRRGLARLAAARALRAAGLYTRALRAVEEARGDLDAAGHPRPAAEALLERAELLQAMEEPDGVPLGRQAAAAAAELGDDRLTARAWIGVFDGLLVQKWTAAGLRELTELVPVIEASATRSGDPGLIVDWRSTLVGYHLLRSDPATALAVSEEAVRSARAQLPPDSGPHERALRRHALVLLWHNRREELEALLPDLVARARRRAGAHPDFARVLTLALSHAGDMNRHDEAIGLALEAMAIYERSFGPDHPKVASAASTAGDALRERGDLREARRLLQRALAILERAPRPSLARELRIRSSLAQIDLDAGDAREAVAALNDVLRAHAEAFGEQDPFTLRRLSEAHALLGQWSDALRAGTQAMQSFAKSFGEDGPLTLVASCFVAWSLVEQGRAREALPLLRRVATCAVCPPNVRAVTAALLARTGSREHARVRAAEAHGWAAGLHPGYRAKLETLLTR